MLDEKMEAELAQSRAMLVEMLPPLWWGIYEACIKEGFTETQSLELVETYMTSTMRTG